MTNRACNFGFLPRNVVRRPKHSNSWNTYVNVIASPNLDRSSIFTIQCEMTTTIVSSTSVVTQIALTTTSNPSPSCLSDSYLVPESPGHLGLLSMGSQARVTVCRQAEKSLLSIFRQVYAFVSNLTARDGVVFVAILKRTFRWEGRFSQYLHYGWGVLNGEESWN